MRPVIVAVPLFLVACLAGALQGKAEPAVLISARFLSMAKPIDVMKIKAIGSVDTKRSPTILQVTPQEAERIEKMVTKAGGELLNAPSVKTTMYQQAKVEVKGDTHSVALTVEPSSRGSDTISLKFRIEVSTKTGNRTVTRSATASARVQEAKALLVIENPRESQPGLLTILRANRTR
jgi:hypothetical protein